MATSIQGRLLLDLVTLIKSLNLVSATAATGSIGDNVLGMAIAEELNVAVYPAVLVYVPDSGEEEEDDSTYEADAVVYPCPILIVDQMRGNFQQARDDYSSWRHAIAQALRGLVAYPLLPNCPELADVRLRNAPPIPRDTLLHPIFRSGLTATCHTTEPRVRR
jgi:hypothetical protein